MKFEVSEENGQVKVVAEIKARKYARDPHSRVETQNVLDFLKSEGYNLNEWKVTKSDLCTTGGKTQRLTGTWVLEKNKVRSSSESRTDSIEQSKQPTKTRKTSTRKKKTPELLRNENVGRVQSQAQTGLRGQDKEISG